MRNALRIGVVGLGKVGLPLALVLRHLGNHSVVGWDIDPAAVGRAQTAHRDNELVHPEAELRELLALGEIPIAPDVERLIELADTIFVVVQTPHPSGYETNMPTSNKVPVDFDYQHVEKALHDLFKACVSLGRSPTIILVSTVSPGTTKRLFNDAPGGVRWAYCPVFISLGRVVRDLSDPGFLLIGAQPDHAEAVYSALEPIWSPVVNTVPWVRVRVEEAEIGKLAYNAHKTLQISFVNQIAQLADALGADVDGVIEVMDGNHAAWRSMGYPNAGLADGGPCRPRDLLVLDRAMLDIGIRQNLLAALAATRDEHCLWYARKLASLEPGWPLVILGRGYKPGVPYTDGSPAMLIWHYLQKLSPGRVVLPWDPWAPTKPDWEVSKAVYFLGTPDERIIEHFHQNPYPQGSFVVDPWGRYLGDEPELTGVHLLSPGRVQ